jgi:hypothetical protein
MVSKEAKNWREHSSNITSQHIFPSKSYYKIRAADAPYPIRYNVKVILNPKL